MFVISFCETFITFDLWGGIFDSLFCLRGKVFIHNYCPRMRILPCLSCSPGGMIIYQTDSCIIALSKNVICQNIIITLT